LNGKKEVVVQLQSPQPVNRRGIRHIDCPLYGDCLMRAAKSDWETWSCDHCTNLKLKAVRQKMRNIESYYQLMAEIYPEFKKKYEPAMTIFNVEAEVLVELERRIGL
jgi:hypothetical protein